MPQGIKNASGCFQRTMCKTFSNQMDKILPPYYHDITITSTSFDHHYANNVKCVLRSVRHAGFTPNASKCSFFQDKIKHLGHIVHHNAIEIDPSRNQTVFNMPVPHDVSSLLRFIGVIQFCHRFLPNLNVLISPLLDLLKCHLTYSWSASCQEIFDTTKSLLPLSPTLCSPSPQDTLVVEINASNVGLGCYMKGIGRNNKQKSHKHFSQLII